MKAILLAGGKGTRLRPLTLNIPKPIVPIFNRPFLLYQLDLLKQVASIDEVILSLNYQPDRIEELIGNIHNLGIKIRYLIEPQPLGTAGAIRFASEFLDDTVIILNGDVLTELNLSAVLQYHRSREANATIVLKPVENPSAYGLVEVDQDGNVKRFLEKPEAEEISCNTINAGVYVIEPSTLHRIPKDKPWSIERSFFPALINDGERFVAYVSSGYWIDIGTPASYRQVHRDIMDGHFPTEPFRSKPKGTVVVADSAQIEDGVTLEGPCFIDEGVVVKTGARIGAYTVLGRKCEVGNNVNIEASILWPSCSIEAEAFLNDVVLGQGCHIGRNAVIQSGVTLGDKAVVPDYDGFNR